MKILSSFLSLLLCFELIISPVAPQVSFLSQKAFANDCPAGTSFNSTLNRCLTTEDTARVMNVTARCAQDDVECYKKNAQEAFQKKVNAGEAPERKGNSAFNSIVQIAAIAGPVTYASIGLSTSTAQCLSGSYYAMVGAAAALVIGDNLANMQHKKRLQKIKEEWGEIVNPEQANGDKDKEREISIEAQSEAFEKLAQAEDSLVKAANLKHKFFLVASLAYGASTVMALIERKRSLAIRTQSTVAVTRANITNTSAATVNPGSVTAQQVMMQLQAADRQLTASNELIEQASSRAAALPVEPASAVSAQSTTAQALEAKAQAAGFVAQATAGVKAATAGLAAANALLPANPAAVETATAALESANTALASAQQLLADTNATLCTAIGVTAYSPFEKSNSLYSYYLNGSKLNIKEELQALYNIENSKDMVSFEINKRVLTGEITTLDDYVFLQNEFKEFEGTDPSVFELFKKTSVALLRNLAPLPSAHAQEFSDVREDNEQVENFRRSRVSSSMNREETSGNIRRTSREHSNTSQINTNAAKQYKEDKGKGINLLNIGLGLGLGYLVAVKTGLQEKLITPTGRAVFSGVMAGMTFMMSEHAKSQAKASKKRAELLRKMKDEFNTSSGAIFTCKSEDRNDPNKPNCYCYTPENKRNPNRGNSQVCQKLWAGKSLKPTDYLAGSNESSKICINNQRNADPTCACRQTKTCMKVGTSGIGGINPGSFSMMSSALQPLNQLSSGAIDAASIDSAALENQAARMRRLTEEVSKKIPIKGLQQAQEKLKKDLAAGSRTLPQSNLLGSTASSNLPSNPREAVNLLEKEIENANTPVATPIGNSAPSLALPNNNPTMPELEFGMTQDEFAAQQGQIAEVMQQNLDYGGNDINQGPSANIFEVLSNRYQRSGMRRLFDESGESALDAPAESDITK